MPMAEGMEKRVAEMQKRVDELRARVLKARDKAAKPERPARLRAAGAAQPMAERPTMDGWIEREKLALAAARERKDERGAYRHTIRLDLLRELSKVGVKAPMRRLDSIERKLDAILERLNK